MRIKVAALFSVLLLFCGSAVHASSLDSIVQGMLNDMDVQSAPKPDGARPVIDSSPKPPDPWQNRDPFADFQVNPEDRATNQDFIDQDKANRAEAARRAAEEQRRLNQEDFRQRMQSNMQDTRPGRKAGRARRPSAQELDLLLEKLNDPKIPKAEKQRLAAVMFVHQDIYRNAVSEGHFGASTAKVENFLQWKSNMQADVIYRMQQKYKAEFGKPLKAPVIPFSYNNVFSDDDIVTGSGKTGAIMERLYVESLDEIVRERAGRPMDADARLRVDVNGLAWDMTQEGGMDNFWHKEKYINPQSGFANQEKLLGSNSVVVYSTDDSGNMIRLHGEAAQEAIRKLAVDTPLKIPGMNSRVGSGSMSDYIRMAELHKVKFKSGTVTVEEIQQFIRNQKYSNRVVSDFADVAADTHKGLAKQYETFVRISSLIREQTTIKAVAEILEKEYGLKIVDSRTGIVDYTELTKAIGIHQNKQLTEALPKMMGAVTQNEAYKMTEWMKNASAADRRLLRKQLALTYAPLTDKQLAQITDDLRKLDVSDTDRAFLLNVLEKDTKQIRRYADLIKIPPGELTTRLKIEGDSRGMVAYFKSTAKFKAIDGAIGSRPGYKKFMQFMESKTARSLNLDVMLGQDIGTGGEKLMRRSMLLLAMMRAYGAATSNKEAATAMGMALFEMVPGVAAVLRFSEDNWREASKELMMDILPPVALANLAVMALNYVAEAEITEFKEGKLDQLAQSVLDQLSDDDFEESLIKGYWVLKNRQELLEFVDEIAPGLGRVAKLSSIIEPQIEAYMSQHKDVKINLQAIHTLQYYEDVNADSILTRYKKAFNLTELKQKVYEHGVPGAESASPVERVAAKIVLDNYRIRTEIYERVIGDFVNRIEKLYNESKKELDDDCSEVSTFGAVVEAITGPDENECDYTALLSIALQKLQEIYNNAPQKIKDSPWGMERLNERYREEIAFLKDYKPASGLDEMGIVKELQARLEAFKEFIKKLEMGVDLYQEQRNMNLRAYFYGGYKAMVSDTEIFKGDLFRVGISANVSSKRGNLKWNVYYYVYAINRGWQLLGSKSLKPGRFSEGEGLWPIVEPEKTSFYLVEGQQLEDYFSTDARGYYRVVAVLAFGDWDTDPVARMGMTALQYPTEYAEFFEEDRVAFAGEPAELFLVQASIALAVPQLVNMHAAEPQVRLAIRSPFYAREETAEADITIHAREVFNGPLPNPDRISDLSMDMQTPSSAFIQGNDSTPEGDYYITVEARLKRILEEFQPKPVTLPFYFTKEKLDEEDSQPSGKGLNALLQEMEGVLSEAAQLVNKATADGAALKALAGQLKSEMKSLNKEIDQVMQELNNLVFNVGLNAANDLTNLQRTLEDVKREGKKLAEKKNPFESAVLSVCTIYEDMSVTDRVSKIQSLYNTALERDNKVKGEFRTTNQIKVELNRLGVYAGGLESSLARYNSNTGQAKTLVDTLVQRVQSMQSRLDEAKRTLETLRGLNSQMEEIVAKAARITDDAALFQSRELTKEQKKALKKINKINRKILKARNKLAGRVDAASGILQEPESTLASITSQVMSLQTRTATTLDDIKSNTDPTKIANLSKDIKSHIEAGLMFYDPIQEANSNEKICMDGIRRLHRQKTSPEAQVAQMDCSKWPGTYAKWSAKDNRPRCYCPDGQEWYKAKNQCYDKRRKAEETLDCSSYSNTQARWSEKDGRALCYCFSGYEWYKDKNRGCHQHRDTLVARHNCSMYPGTSPKWDVAAEQVKCFCPDGHGWDKTLNQCYSRRERAISQLRCNNCSYPTYDAAKNKAWCACNSNCEYDSYKKYCVPYGTSTDRRRAEEEARRREEERRRRQQDMQELADGLVNILDTFSGGQGNTGNGRGGGGQTNSGGGQSTSRMSGNCSGTISTSASAGRAGSPHTITVRIDSYYAPYVAKVTSDNPGCRNCDLPRTGNGVYSRTFYFTGRPGTFTLTYIAYDNNGKNMCSGSLGLRVVP